VTIAALLTTAAAPFAVGALAGLAGAARHDLGLAIVLLTAITVAAAAAFLIARFGFVPVGSDSLPGPLVEG
jgi:hypothetical protein